MIIFSNTADFQLEDDCVVTIGKFDGEHAGHKLILSNMRQMAKEENLKIAVFTFANPPSYIVDGLGSNLQITTNEERRERFREECVDYLVEFPFTEEISKLDAEDFVKKILLGQMRMKAIVVGEDCAFGYQKRGNIALLEEMKEKYGFHLAVIQKLRDRNDREISSTMIRDLIQQGKIEEVNTLLNSIYSIRGKVFVGNRLGGKVLGFPTVNIYAAPEKITPRHGVYATKLLRLSNQKEYFGLTNIGTNPSVEEDSFKHRERVETWIFDFDEEIYGEEVEVGFYSFIRGEEHFPSLDLLKNQIEMDKKAVAKYWGLKA